MVPLKYDTRFYRGNTPTSYRIALLVGVLGLLAAFLHVWG